jgi:hypothetical protein
MAWKCIPSEKQLTLKEREWLLGRVYFFDCKSRSAKEKRDEADELKEAFQSGVDCNVSYFCGTHLDSACSGL